MTTIKVNRHHKLGSERARETVDKLARKLEKDLDAQCRWEGSTLVFSRSGASGKIDVSDDEIDLEIKLGLLLRPLKGTIERTIEEEMDRYLEA